VPYPNFPDKHAHPALFEPQEFLAYLRAQGAVHPSLVPESFVLLYERRLFEAVEADSALEPVAHRNRRYYSLARDGNAIGVAGGFGAGAPAATMVLEELTALGARRFISIGLAGALDPSLSVGDIVVCREAIRDEGVSHHYLAPGGAVRASLSLTEYLEHALHQQNVEFRCGASWTIDTPYRETAAEVRHYRSEGVLTVEMEAAALFAVAAYRGIDLTAGFVISDLLSDERWHPQFHNAMRPLHLLYTAALEALASPS